MSSDFNFIFCNFNPGKCLHKTQFQHTVPPTPLHWSWAAITHWPHFIGTSKQCGTITEFRSERTRNVKWSLSRLKSKIQRRTQTMGAGDFSKVIYSKYYKHLAYALAHEMRSVCFSLFWHKKVHFKPRLTVSCGHYNVLQCTESVQFCTCFAHKNIKNPDCPIGQKNSKSTRLIWVLILLRIFIKLLTTLEL